MKRNGRGIRKPGRAGDAGVGDDVIPRRGRCSKVERVRLTAKENGLVT